MNVTPINDSNKDAQCMMELRKCTRPIAWMLKGSHVYAFSCRMHLSQALDMCISSDMRHDLDLKTAVIGA